MPIYNIWLNEGVCPKDDANLASFDSLFYLRLFFGAEPSDEDITLKAKLSKVLLKSSIVLPRKNLCRCHTNDLCWGLL